MPRQEHFITNVICPKCGQSGVVKLEESELPVYQQGEWSTTFTRVSTGLKLGPKAKVLCGSCGVEVVLGAEPRVSVRSTGTSSGGAKPGCALRPLSNAAGFEQHGTLAQAGPSALYSRNRL